MNIRTIKNGRTSNIGVPVNKETEAPESLVAKNWSQKVLPPKADQGAQST